MKLLNKWRSYIQLMRLDKPIGSFLLLWLTLWALFLASNGMPMLRFCSFYLRCGLYAFGRLRD